MRKVLSRKHQNCPQKRRDIDHNTLDYFLFNNPKLGSFYLLPKIHKRLQNVLGSHVISKSKYYTANISALLEFHLKPLAKKVKSYIKDTNDIENSQSPSISRWHHSMHYRSYGFTSKYPAWSRLDRIQGRQDNIYRLLNAFTECVLKNNIFEHNLSFLQQLRGTAIETKMTPPYAFIFWETWKNISYKTSVLNH